MKTMISIRQKALLPFYLFTFSLLFAACQDTEWDVYTPNGASLYGNSSIDDSNIVTIAQLKQMYPNVFATTDQNALVDKDLKIKGRVTANDIRGNIYKQFMMQDETGAIIVAVNESGISGYLAEGQEIIVDLKGLYVGAYGGMAEIGVPYNGSIGRMSKDLWATHYKIVGGLSNVEPNAIEPVDFAVAMQNMDNAGMLVTLSGVHFAAADGNRTLIDGAASGGNYYSQQLKEYGSNVIIRTSSYADFAAMIMPTGACNITGIATRFNSTWQIMIRKTSDIEVVEK